jgi:inosine-uridine nucleoside N-ribohydrolase
MAAKPSPIQLWVDSDPSGLYLSGLDCDDDLAILIAYALHQRELIKLVGMSICGGNAPLRHTWEDALTLWEYANGYRRTGIKPIKGYGWRSMQVGVTILQFYNIIFQDVIDSDDAAEAISKHASDAAEEQHRLITILSLGPPTNIAAAIQRLDASQIEHIYLMGGEMTHQELDLNFRTDRASARKVIETNVPKTIIPIQTCAQVAVTEEWISTLGCPQRKNMAVCTYLSKMRQQIRLMPLFVNSAVKKRMLANWEASPNLDRGFIPWDVVALLAITHPEEFVDWKYYQLSMPSCNGQEPCDGTMTLIEYGDSFDSDKNWSNMVRIPQKVSNETRLLELMLDLIREIDAPSSSRQNRMRWGFTTDFVIVTSMIILFCTSMFVHRRKSKQKIH